MRAPLPRLVRLGLPAVAVLALALGGCGEPAPSAPTPSEAPSATPSGSPTPLLSPTDAGSGGLTVRYLGADGRVKTVRVEDFRH